MSLLTPVKVPVKVYRWDDAGAPALDKTAGCMMTIFKACLITGYGTKEPAGWTMPFEDTTAGIKVLRPEVGPHTDFYLRLSADTGTEIAAQVYLNMTDANTGDLKLQCATPFKYAKKNSTGKWLLIACPRGFWFFCEQAYTATDIGKKGAYFFSGDTTSGDVDRVVYLQHTGGAWEDGDYSNIMGWRQVGVQGQPSNYNAAVLLTSANAVNTTNLVSVTTGVHQLTTDNTITTPILIAQQKAYMLPGLYIPLNATARSNFDTLSIGSSKAINFGMSGSGVSNAYIATDYWWY